MTTAKDNEVLIAIHGHGATDAGNFTFVTRSMLPSATSRLVSESLEGRVLGTELAGEGSAGKA